MLHAILYQKQGEKREEGTIKGRRDRQASKMAGGAGLMHTPFAVRLNSVLRTHVKVRELIPQSCPLTSAHTLE